MNVVLISVGDELLAGRSVNTNASWLGERLFNAGHSVLRVSTIGDEEDLIVAEVSAAADQADAIIVTGGLGPTNDDRTREAVCRLLDTTMVVDSEQESIIRERAERRGMSPNDRSLRQARVPEGVDVLHNLEGTAPGMRFRVEKALVYAMPGVPYEMRAMYEQHVSADLGQTTERRERVWTLHGIPESELADRLTSFEADLPERMSLAYLPSYGTIRLRLIEDVADGGTEEELNRIASWLNAIVEDLALTDVAESLPEAIGRLLRDEGATMSVAESCTGGLLGSQLTAVPGSSAWFAGGIISYTNDAKREMLSVSANLLEEYGAVSREVAEAMAAGALQRFDVDYAISITGIAGPEGGTDQKPVGTVWIGCADSDMCSAALFRFNGSRDVVRQFSVNAAMATIIRRIRGMGDETLGGVAFRSA